MATRLISSPASPDPVSANRAAGLLGPGAAVLIVCVSALVAICAGLVSRFAWRPGPLMVPWGLLLGLASALAVVVLARQFGRAHGFLAVGGWIIGLAAILLGRPEGDFVIASDLLGWAFLLAPIAVLVAAATWGGAPDRGRRPLPEAQAQSGSSR
jgi:hypothetical protein